jgi:hypothetical protein
MSAQSKNGVAAAVLVGVLVLGHGGTSRALDPGAEPQAPQAAPRDDGPGEHHEHLDRLAGTWEFTAQIWVPGQDDPVESSGTLSSVWILAGRFLRTELTSTFMGQPYEGVGIDGYDNAAGHYVATWVESTGTAMSTLEGACDTEGRVRTMNTATRDPASGETLEIKSVTTVLNDNSYMYESFVVGSDGTEVKQLELVARRRS